MCRTVSPRRPSRTYRIATVVGLVAVAFGLAWRRSEPPSRGHEQASLPETRGPRSEVLGSFASINDAVANTYDRDSKKPPSRPVRAPQSDPKWQEQKSGLGFGAPSPKFSPFGNIFEPEDDDDADDQPPVAAAAPPSVGYRTVCVRLCDGAYFPVSFSTFSDRFKQDEETCQKSCSSPSRLYVYENPGGSPEAMKDLEGHPYTDLQTAFLFRTTYNPSCACKAQPWTEAAAARHRGYAFEALAEAGDPQAVAQVGSVETAMAESMAAERKLLGATDTAAARLPRPAQSAPVTASSGYSQSSVGSPTDPRYGMWGKPRYAQSQPRGLFGDPEWQPKSADPRRQYRRTLRRAPRGFGSDD